MTIYPTKEDLARLKRKEAMNEPQLSAEMEKRIDDLHAWYINGQIITHPDRDKLFITKVGHFLATALEEQKQKYIGQVEALGFQGTEYNVAIAEVLNILRGEK